MKGLKAVIFSPAKVAQLNQNESMRNSMRALGQAVSYDMHAIHAAVQIYAKEGLKSILSSNYNWCTRFYSLKLTIDAKKQ